MYAMYTYQHFLYCVLHMLYQNKIVSFFWDTFHWTQWEDDKYFLEIYSIINCFDTDIPTELLKILFLMPQ